MAKTHLTVKHRPQTFAEVAGQGTVRAILSRAAETGAVAPAYMFSGTRGVGKTTLARILAKAINCENGPAAEPCNKCGNCKRIQAGSSVDVVEIDAASHTGVDNIRSLKEDVGYAPMDCRYKVFIIDEAHMLSKSAFNALLKTLEEPPGRVTFIMATTEPHKFPPTIISRCQHYVFQRLTQKEIAEHLTKILDLEGVKYEPAALNLLARRGAGSVRDAMSLLGQVLALGGETLGAGDVRQVLGLAGQEVFFRLVEGIHAQDPLAVIGVLREIMDQGLDLGFFLSELTQVWRNMFLLSQTGERAFSVLDVPEEDAAKWLEWVPKFSLPHIHACWQMTLEGQQRVKGSLDPALALELLLLNLAYLPRLLPLEDAPEMAAASGGSSGAPQTPPAGGSAPKMRHPAKDQAREQRPKAHKPQIEPEPEAKKTPKQEPEAEPKAEAMPEPKPEAAAPSGPRDWEGFMHFVSPRAHDAGLNGGMLKNVGGDFAGGKLTVSSYNGFVMDKLESGESADRFKDLAQEFFGQGTTIEFKRTQGTTKTRADLEREAKEHPLVQEAVQELDAGIMGVEFIKPANK
jgi:DNA polymerase-3 subunit gamma/tau